MGILKDKSSVLGRIKEFYKIKTNAELSRFLGISPSNLSNWYSRNTIDYDLVFAKCADINLDWLLTGIRKYPQSENIQDEQVFDIEKSENERLTIDQTKSWKDFKGYWSLMQSITKRNKLDAMDIEYSQIVITFSVIKDMAEYYQLSDKFAGYYDALKSNKMSLVEVIKKANEASLIEKELYEIIEPYNTILEELYDKIVAFDLEHDKAFDISDFD